MLLKNIFVLVIQRNYLHKYCESFPNCIEMCDCLIKNVPIINDVRINSRFSSHAYENFVFFSKRRKKDYKRRSRCVTR